MKGVRAMLLITGIFALLTMPFARVGKPVNPAFEQLRKAQSPLDIAVLGDSRPHTGISPTELTLALDEFGFPGMRAHNFAVDGSDSLHALSFLRNGLLKQERAPRLLIWATNPLQFDESRKNNRLEYLEGADLVPLLQSGAPVELLLDVATMAIFPPWRLRPQAKQWIAAKAVSAGLRSLPFQKKILGLNWAEEIESRRYVELDDGQVPFEVLDWKKRYWRGAKSYVGEYEKLSVSHWHLAVGRRLLREAREHGVQVLVLEMPVSPWFQTTLASSKKHLAWRAAMMKMAEEEGALFQDHSGLYAANDALFGDPGHMQRTQACVYSRDLARQLAAEPRITRSLLQPIAKAGASRAGERVQ